jgi:outer membrane protein insertion porin family
MKILRIITLMAILAGIGSAALAKDNTDRLKVHDLNFEGNDVFGDFRLRKVMVTHRSRLFSRFYFNPDILTDDLKSVELFYHQHGYLDAKVVHNEITVDTSKLRVDIDIFVEEGTLTRVQEISLQGSRAFGDSLILKKVDLKPGDIFEQPKLQQGTLAIVQKYADNGFLDAEVRPEVTINSQEHLASINLQVIEGPQYTIEQIRLEGLQQTKLNVALREMTFKIGQEVSLSRLLDSQRRLYLLGLFQSVFIRPVTSLSADSSRKDILIKVIESKPIQLNITVGYGTVEMGRAQADIAHHNIFGTGHKIGISGNISFINRGLELNYTSPWTFGVPWRTDIKLNYEFLQQPSYNQIRRSASVVFGHHVGRRIMLSNTYRIEDSRLHDIKVADVPPNLTSSVSSIKPAVIFDTRDDIFNSRKGLYLELSEELAGTFLGGNNNFLRHIVRASYFIPLSQTTVLATALDAGLINDLGDTAHVALSERFYAGGPNSMRGFSYQHLGPKGPTGVPSGGTLKLVFNLLELRQTFNKFLGAALFVDVGNVWSNPEDFRLSDLRTSPGLGLRVGTPLGFVRLDCGFNPQPIAGEEPARFYFAIGQAF